MMDVRTDRGVELREVDYTQTGTLSDGTPIVYLRVPVLQDGEAIVFTLGDMPRIYQAAP